MNETQNEAIAVLAEILELAPEIRLGQLMSHIGLMGDAHVGKGLGYIEDDELVAVLYRHRAELTARLEEAEEDSVSISGSPTSPVTSA